MFNRMLIAYNRIYAFKFCFLQAIASQVYHRDGFSIDLIVCLSVLRHRMECVSCGLFSNPGSASLRTSESCFLPSRFQVMSAFSHLLDGLLSGLFGSQAYKSFSSAILPFLMAIIRRSSSCSLVQGPQRSENLAKGIIIGFSAYFLAHTFMVQFHKMDSLITWKFNNILSTMTQINVNAPFCEKGDEAIFLEEAWRVVQYTDIEGAQDPNLSTNKAHILKMVNSLDVDDFQEMVRLEESKFVPKKDAPNTENRK